MRVPKSLKVLFGCFLDGRKSPRRTKSDDVQRDFELDRKDQNRYKAKF